MKKNILITALAATIVALIAFRSSHRGLQQSAPVALTSTQTSEPVTVHEPVAAQQAEVSADAPNLVSTTSGLLTLQVAPQFSRVLPSQADQKHALAMNEWFKKHGVTNNHSGQQ
jgi:hypothetical protein